MTRCGTSSQCSSVWRSRDKPPSASSYTCRRRTIRKFSQFVLVNGSISLDAVIYSNLNPVSILLAGRWQLLFRPDEIFTNLQDYDMTIYGTDGSQHQQRSIHRELLLNMNLLLLGDSAAKWKKSNSDFDRRKEYNRLFDVLRPSKLTSRIFFHNF